MKTQCVWCRNYINSKFQRYRVSHSLPNPALKILQRNLNRSMFVVWEMKRNVSVVHLIVATRSSGQPASGKIIKEMPGSVASGTPYIKRCCEPDTVLLFSPSHYTYINPNLITTKHCDTFDALSKLKE